MHAGACEDSQEKPPQLLLSSKAPPLNVFFSLKEYEGFWLGLKVGFVNQSIRIQNS